MSIDKFLSMFLKDDIKDINIQSIFEDGRKIYKIKCTTRDDNTYQIILSGHKIKLLSEFFTCLESKIYHKTIVNVSDGQLDDKKIYNISTLDNMNISLSCIDGSTDFYAFNEYIDNKRRSDCYIRYSEIISFGNVKELVIQEDKESNKINSIKLDDKSYNVNYHISLDKVDDEREKEKIFEMINGFVKANGNIVSIEDKCHSSSNICVSKTITLQKDNCKIIIKGVRLIEALKDRIDKIEGIKKLEMRSE